MKESDKRLSFPFGANLTPLGRLRGAGLTIRLSEGQLLVSPGDSITPEIREMIQAHRQEILDELDLEMRSDALGKLPWPDEPVDLREGTLLKLEDGSYLAVTPEELSHIKPTRGDYVGLLRFMLPEVKWSKWEEVSRGDSEDLTWVRLLRVCVPYPHVERKVQKEMN
jgi:hypothetical protein